MDFKKVKAVLAVKENRPEDVGKIASTGNDDDALLFQITPDVETEVYTKYDFEEPQEENFHNFVNKIKDDLPEGVTLTYLTDLED